MKLNLTHTFFYLLFVSIAFGNPSFQSPSIKYESACKLVAEVLKEAEKRGLTIAVAISDSSGHLVAFGRMDGTKPIVLEVALGKAYSSAVARNKTSVLQEKAMPGGPGYGGITNLKGIITIRGGEPIVFDGECIGAIGVSGTTAVEDEELAELAIKLLFQKE